MIKRIGNTPIQERHKASCHCGAVVLELTLPDGVVDPRRCDCSLCRRRGAIVASVPLSGIRILQGRRRCAATSSTPAPPSTTSAASAASTPTISAAPIRPSMVTTSPASKASIRSNWARCHCSMASTIRRIGWSDRQGLICSCSALRGCDNLARPAAWRALSPHNLACQQGARL